MSRKWLALAFPYICLALVVSLLVYDNLQYSFTTTTVTAAEEDVGALICMMCDREVGEPGKFTSERNGVIFDFCCPGCAWAFNNMDQAQGATGGGAFVDLVCQMEIGTGIELLHEGKSYYFCTSMCRELFAANPEMYLAETCIVCRTQGAFKEVGEGSPQATWQEKTYRLCGVEHKESFTADPGGYFMHTMWGIPPWLYYCSIAFILLLSFGIIEARSARREARQRPRQDLIHRNWLLRAFKSNASRFIGRLLLVSLFLLIIAAGLFGNQLPQKNIAPLLTWTIWWGGLIWLVAYLGKAFCYVCPWDAISDWAEGLRFWGPKKEGLGLNLKWPTALKNIWPATILFIALTWVELGFGVTMIPRATAWLALTMLALAFISAFVFDRRSFCRYGCLVGRISGLYALFAPIELRARDTEVCRVCDTKSCFKGNEQGEPCPTFEFMGAMDQNTYCISCMECVKSCEKDNVAMNLRPWGEDLAHHHRPRADEAYLALIMLSLTGFHGLTMTAAWSKVAAWISAVFHVSDNWAFSIGMVATMVAPVLLYAGLVWLSRLLAIARTISYREYFIRYAYALLPIALFYHLAHNSEHLLMEGQKIIPLLSDPFGFQWNLLGTAKLTLRPLIKLENLWILQVFFVMIGHVYSLWAARRAAGALFGSNRAALRSQIVMLVAMILFSLMSLWLLKQPMMMRTSAM